MISKTKKTSLPISRDNVSISDAGIISRYFGIDKYPVSISSPLRDDDDNPSFSMQERDGRVYWKDFGTGEAGNAVSLMARLWHTSYSEALMKIKLDTTTNLSGVTCLYPGKQKRSHHLHGDLLF